VARKISRIAVIVVAPRSYIASLSKISAAVGGSAGGVTQKPSSEPS